MTEQTIANAQLFRWEQDSDGVVWMLTRGPGTRLGYVRMRAVPPTFQIMWTGQAASGYVVGESQDRVTAMALVEAWEHTGPRPLVFKVRINPEGDDRVELDVEGLMRLSTPAESLPELVAVAWEGIATFLGLAPERVIVEMPDVVVEAEDPECE